MLERAFSILEVKSVDRAQRIIEGIASTPTPDRGGDIMEPAGAQFALPMPFLWFHNAQDPIGEVFAADVRPDGIHIRARVSHVTLPGRLKALVDDAWAAFTAQPPLVRGLSIGWKPLDMAPIAGTAYRRVKRWMWGELSAVTLPMNAEATILAVKSADAAARAATGGARIPSTPGAAGRSGPTSMTISEQITAAKAELQTKSARLDELMARDADEGGLNDAEAAERDGLAPAIKSAMSQIERLAVQESAQAMLAKKVEFQLPTQTAHRGRVEITRPDLPKGTGFTRVVMAVAAGKGSYSDTLAFAKQWDSQTPEVSAFIRAGFHKAIEGTSTIGSPAWGGELVPAARTMVADFAELMRPATLIGRIPGFRMTPFNVQVQVQTGGSLVNWVDEGAVKPVGELAFSLVTLPYHKIAGIVVLTEELVRLSTPSAEETVRRDLIASVAQFQDEQFLNPAITATSARPASITNGVSSPAASGTDATALFVDLNAALATFDTADMGTEGVVIVMSPALARGISTLRNSLGQVETGISMTPTGGTLLGFPVFVSNSVPSGTIVLFKPSEILLADDGRVTVDASNQATLDMNGGSSPVFSLWQRNCIGLRAERWITWLPRRSGAVAMIDTAAYGPTTTP